jgi:hypothetical protein
MLLGVTAALAPPVDHLPPEALASAARSAAGAGSLGFRVGASGTGLTYRVDGDTVVVTDGLDGADTVVALDEQAWSDLTAQVRTCINLFLASALSFERGGFEQLMRWDPALRLLHAGIPIYDPARADLRGRDPEAVMSLDDTDEELAAQLDTMGYLHVRAVFSAAEMAEANAEVDRLAGLARPGDDLSWWAVAEDGSDALCRLIYATQRSESLARLEQDPRVARLGRLLDPGGWLAADRMEGSPVLLKVPGKTKGLANIPWHQDCGMGGHAIICPSVTIGIQLTGSSAATGNLQVIPGSHGQTLYYGWDREPDGVPVVSIDTEPGDVTVHVQDVMHASPKPVGDGGRRTFYVTFYPPTLRDHVGVGQAFNDLVRNRTTEVDRLRGRD